jgi:hypothetical protein
MNRADTLARVKMLGATDARPVLADADVQTLVDQAAIADANGNSPHDLGEWVETYDVNLALALVWATKAARVAGDFNFSADDASFQKGDVLAHCLDMEAKYRAMVGSTSGEGTGNAGTIQVRGTGSGPAWAEKVLP